MNVVEAFLELDKLYESDHSLIEGRSMPYALLVLLNGTWKVYKGLDSVLTEDEIAEFLKDKPEYTNAKVIASSDIYKYVTSSTNTLQEGISRAEIINQLKALGKNYYFDSYSDEQLYWIWKKAVIKKEEDEAMKDFYNSKVEKPTCDNCGRRLADDGSCPTCDHGEEELEESAFDGSFNRSNWISMTPNKNIQAPQAAPANSESPTQTLPSTQPNSGANGYLVTIMWDGNKFRARADDGIHGRANVAFPTALRTKNGQKYEVERLTWNGKNYRASGRITPVIE